MRIPSIRAGETSDAPAKETAPSGTIQAGTIDAGIGGKRGPVAYLGRMWRAEIPLSRIFWRDMVVVGSILNIAAMGLAFLAAALGASTAIGIVIFLSPVPYSIFLVVAVWRRADIEPSEWSWLARIGALAWLLFSFAV